MIATGDSDAARADAEVATRAQIAFYASTPAYRPVLERHDRGELQPVLRERTKADDWAGLLELVDDDLFDLVAIRGTPASAGASSRPAPSGWWTGWRRTRPTRRIPRSGRTSSRRSDPRSTAMAERRPEAPEPDGTP